MLIIYHNPRCRKSRAGLEYLKSKNIQFQVVDYINKGIDERSLHEILLKTNLKPFELLRKQEEVFKKELKGKSFTNDEWVKIICENPKLLQRPIVVGKLRAVLGDPPENIDKLIT